MGLPIGRGTRRQFRCLTLGRGRRILERHPLEVAAIFAVGGSEIRDDGVVAWAEGKRKFRSRSRKKTLFAGRVARGGACHQVRDRSPGPSEEKRVASHLAPARPERPAHFGPWAPISGAALSADEQGCRAPTARRGVTGQAQSCDLGVVVVSFHVHFAK